MAYGFRPVQRDALMLLPPDLRDWLREDHLAWLVLEVVDQLDLSGIESEYRLGSTGRRAYDPSMLTALLVYGYCCGQRSSRRIEEACETDVAFRVISAQQRPDHTTIARFRAAHAQALAALFGQVLTICGRAGLAKVGIVAIDGTKIAANASPGKNYDEDRLRKMAAAMLAEAEAVDAAEDAEHGTDRGDELPSSLRPGPDRRHRLKAALDSIEADRADRIGEDVAHAERRRGRVAGSLRTAVSRSEAIHAGSSRTRSDRRPISEHKEVREAIAKLAQAEDQLAEATAGRGRRASTDMPVRRNTTDPDSRLMPTRGKGFVQGFNAQIAVSDDHVVIATDVTDCSNDLNAFTPMLALAVASVAQNLPHADIGTVLADAGYCTEESLTTPGPDRLIATGRDPAKKADNGTAATRQMAKRLHPDSPDRVTYRRRQATVEPVIGQLKDRIGLRRFSRRGIQAARHELALAAIAHNIRRLATV
jgi:transposase